MDDSYKLKLAGMSDEELTKEVSSKVFLSAYAANNPRSKYHAECDATYDEAKQRGKLWLYQRGWNDAAESAGHEISEANIKAAMRPSGES